MLRIPIFPTEFSEVISIVILQFRRRNTTYTKEIFVVSQTYGYVGPKLANIRPSLTTALLERGRGNSCVLFMLTIRGTLLLESGFWRDVLCCTGPIARRVKSFKEEINTILILLIFFKQPMYFLSEDVKNVYAIICIINIRSAKPFEYFLLRASLCRLSFTCRNTPD